MEKVHGHSVRTRSIKRTAIPTHERFNRRVLRQSQAVVHLGGVGIALLGAFPKLTLVGAGKERAILLRLMLEDRGALARHFVGRERHGHFGLLDVPL